MYILHIETSTKICSVAVSHGDKLIGSLDMTEGMNHSALLAPAIEELLLSKGVQLSQLSAISVSSGPGSFTGLRVGGSTAKAMAYSLNVPILAVPTLLALAGAARGVYQDAEWIMPMIDARRNEVYTAIYDRDLQEVMPVSSLIIENLVLEELVPAGKKGVMCGDGAKKVESGMVNANSVIDKTIQCSAVHLVEPAYRLWTLHEYADPMHFVPFYLKPPNITKPRLSV